MEGVIRLISFTTGGKALGERVISSFGETTFITYEKGDDLNEFCKSAFQERAPIIFISATGIAVRTVAPLLKDKLSDPPVIVMDEGGNFVIPIVSGHYGGGNRLASELAERIGAVPVITTATDVNSAFSVDSFALEKGLEVVNKDGIKKVSTKALEGKPIVLSIKNYPPKEKVDVIISDECIENQGKAILGLKGEIQAIIDKGIVLGVGCKRGKKKEEIKALAEECLNGLGLTLEDITAVSTIDIKEREQGILDFIEEMKIPLITFDAEILGSLEGDFTSSEFVNSKVGVDNVCERSALAATGGKGEIILRKTARDGVTISLVRI